MEMGELIKRYQHMKFDVQNSILDIGVGNGVFILSRGIKGATIADLTINKNLLFKYVHAGISERLISQRRFETIFIGGTLKHLGNTPYLLDQVYDLLLDRSIYFISITYTKIGKELHRVCIGTKKKIIGQTRKLGFIPKVIQKRKQFKGFGFWLPHCWLVLELRKRKIKINKANIRAFNMDLKDEKTKI